MPSPLIPDSLWSIVAPLLPPAAPKPKGGRPPVADRAALTGILFVLRSGIPWEMLPAEMGCGSGVTCWRRLRDWQNGGVWDRLHRELLRRLRNAERIDWSRACIDGSVIAAKKGAPRPARTRPIAVGPAQNDTSRPIAAVFRSPSC
jgi:transposase